MRTSHAALVGCAAFGLALYGCGQLMGEAGPRAGAAPGRALGQSYATLAGPGGGDWRIAAGAAGSQAVAAAPEAAQAPPPPDPWKMEAEWAPPD